jgi:hypothetical protein
VEGTAGHRSCLPGADPGSALKGTSTLVPRKRYTTRHLSIPGLETGRSAGFRSTHPRCHRCPTGRRARNGKKGLSSPPSPDGVLPARDEDGVGSEVGRLNGCSPTDGIRSSLERDVTGVSRLQGGLGNERRTNAPQPQGSDRGRLEGDSPPLSTGRTQEIVFRQERKRLCSGHPRQAEQGSAQRTAWKVPRGSFKRPPRYRGPIPRIGIRPTGRRHCQA